MNINFDIVSLALTPLTSSIYIILQPFFVPQFGVKNPSSHPFQILVGTPSHFSALLPFPPLCISYVIMYDHEQNRRLKWTSSIVSHSTVKMPPNYSTDYGKLKVYFLTLIQSHWIEYEFSNCHSISYFSMAQERCDLFFRWFIFQLNGSNDFQILIFFFRVVEMFRWATELISNV